MKKQILRIISLILALFTVCVVFVGCDPSDKEGGGKLVAKLNKQTPYEVYSTFQEQIDKMGENYSGTGMSIMEIDSINPVSGTNHFVSKGEFVGKYYDSQNFYFTFATNPATSEMELWYVDGMFYFAYAGAKVKAEAPKEKVENFVSRLREIMLDDEGANENHIMGLPESWFKDVMFEQTDNGNYLIKLDMSGEKIGEAITRLGLMSASGSTVTDIKLTYTVDKEGTLISIDQTFGMEMSQEGLFSSVCRFSSIVTYTDVGTTKKTTAPEDADSYRLVNYEDFLKEYLKEIEEKKRTNP